MPHHTAPHYMTCTYTVPRRAREREREKRNVSDSHINQHYTDMIIISTSWEIIKLSPGRTKKIATWRLRSRTHRQDCFVVFA